MSLRVSRLTPLILIFWVLIGTLIPRVLPVRAIYLVNSYALVPVLAGVALLDQVLRRWGRRTFRIEASDAALGGFLLWAVASIALQDQPHAVLWQDFVGLWRTFVIPAAAFWVIRLTRLDERDLANWVVPLAALCVVELAVSLLAWFQPAWLPGFWSGSIQEMGGVRIVGTLTQPDVYAAVLVFSATVLAVSGMMAVSGLTRFLANSGIVLAFTGVFLSYSRASWVGGLAALAVLAASCGRKIIVPCVVLALAVTGLARARGHGGNLPVPAGLVGPAAAAPARENESYATTRLMMTWTIRDRIVLDAAGLKLFLRKPLLGWGFGTYDRLAHGFVTSVGPFAATDWDKNEAASHCTHLSILAEMGVVGYGLLMFPVVRLVVAMIRRRNAFERDRPLVGLWAIVVFLGVVSLLVDLRYVALSLGLGGLVLGLISVRVEADGPTS